jgi:hypothetical protein
LSIAEIIQLQTGNYMNFISELVRILKEMAMDYFTLSYLIYGKTVSCMAKVVGVS